MNYKNEGTYGLTNQGGQRLRSYEVLVIQATTFRRTVLLDQINQKVYTIGRDMNNTVVLSSRQVSRRHASLIRKVDVKTQESFYWIIDGDMAGNKSSNGVYVNDDRCSTKKLKHGDVVSLGDEISLTYYTLSSPSDVTLLKSRDYGDRQEARIGSPLDSPITPIISASPTLLIEEEELPRRRGQKMDTPTIISSGSLPLPLTNTTETESIVLVDIESHRILQASNDYCNMLEYSQAEIEQLTLEDLVAFEYEVVESKLQQLLENKEQDELTGESVHRSRTGKVFPVEVNINKIYSGQKKLYYCIIKHTEVPYPQAQDFQEVVGNKQQQSHHDPLTGLYNKKVFREQLDEAIAQAEKNKNLLAVLQMDLDNIKAIESTLGVEVADQAIKALAARLRTCMRAGDTVARGDGNQFMILLPKVSNTKDTLKVAKRILNLLKEPFEVGKEVLRVRASIGVTFYPDDGETASDLIKNADAVVQKLKKQGGNNCALYNSQVQDRAQAQIFLQIEKLLDEALERDQLYLLYQPQINVATGRITGVECFLRWQHPQFGVLLPGKFIPQAEESGLIIPIGDMVLQKACLQNVYWQGEGLPKFPIAVNISYKEFQQKNLASKIEQLLRDTQLSAELLELEITESFINEDPDFAFKTLRRLDDIGIRICIDDFGTGAASIGYLKEFPFRRLKINPGFLLGIGDKNQEMAMIAAFINLGRTFNIKVVAEGVERQEQVEVLRSLHCEEMQGNLFTRPIKGEDVIDFVCSFSPSWV